MDNSMQDSAVNNSSSVNHPDSAAVPRTEAVKVSRELLDFMYQLPKSHEEPKSIYWMLIAVHGLTAILIPLLEKVLMMLYS